MSADGQDVAKNLFMRALQEIERHLPRTVDALRLRWYAPWAPRAWLALRFIRGTGIEIGALHHPLPVPATARVRYVDRLTRSEIGLHYAEVPQKSVVTPDIIDDGEYLTTIKAESCDFVIANQFLEHTQNPLGTLATFMRVLKCGGIIYMALPDKRFTFESQRPATTFKHLVRDYREGPAWSREEHYREWVRYTICPPDEAVFDHHVQHLKNIKHPIHFHAWTRFDMIELLLRVRSEVGLCFEVEVMYAHEIEVIFILRKTT